MNRYDLRGHLRQELAPFCSSFHTTSHDTQNDEHLCSDKTSADVYDFDAYVKARHGKGNLPASPDAIHIGKKKLYFVEFKSQRASDIAMMGTAMMGTEQ